MLSNIKDDAITNPLLLTQGSQTHATYTQQLNEFFYEVSTAIFRRFPVRHFRPGSVKF
jgi:hypothetical protein